MDYSALWNFVPFGSMFRKLADEVHVPGGRAVPGCHLEDLGLDAPSDLYMAALSAFEVRCGAFWL